MTRKNKSDLDRVWAEINRIKVEILNIQNSLSDNDTSKIKKNTNKRVICPRCGRSSLNPVNLGSRELLVCKSEDCGWRASSVQKV